MYKLQIVPSYERGIMDLKFVCMPTIYILKSRPHPCDLDPIRWYVCVCVCVCVLVAQSCLPLCDPSDCSLPGFSVHGIVQARILEWIAIPFSRGTSQPR